MGSESGKRFAFWFYSGGIKRTAPAKLRFNATRNENIRSFIPLAPYLASNSVCTNQKWTTFAKKQRTFSRKRGTFEEEVHPFPFPHPRLRRKHQAERMKFARQRVRIKIG